jgi:hypothetical protein
MDNWNSNYNFAQLVPSRGESRRESTYAQKLIVREDVVITAVEMEFDVSRLASCCVLIIFEFLYLLLYLFFLSLFPILYLYSLNSSNTIHLFSPL